jgi:hypothetical protein
MSREISRIFITGNSEIDYLKIQNVAAQLTASQEGLSSMSE